MHKVTREFDKASKIYKNYNFLKPCQIYIYIFDPVQIYKQVFF